MQAAIIVKLQLYLPFSVSVCRGGLLNFDRKSRGPKRQAQLKLKRRFFGMEIGMEAGGLLPLWDGMGCLCVWVKVVRHAEWPQDRRQKTIDNVKTMSIKLLPLLAASRKPTVHSPKPKAER